ncbi:MAG: methyltransferase [Methylobacillus sp.]|jgi:predicted methyltransferase|nr:methyltransferase [Methylobacillus sp.]
MKHLLLAAILAILPLGAVHAQEAPIVLPDPPTLEDIIAEKWSDPGKKWRAPANVARDRYRHPLETLTFFGITAQDQEVIEITPGGGWYSEILAPYLRKNFWSRKNQYVAAVNNDAKALRAKFTDNPMKMYPWVYDQVEIRTFDPKQPIFGPADSADAVLTFRNVHNWVKAGSAEAYFKAFFDVLKPGGTLGVVDHRAKPGTDLETMKKSGYLTEELVIGLATQAGFVLAEKSEINANPADTTDHPNGVWTLPPSNKHDAADDAKYKAIGESDRMTLKFVKPGGAP